MKKDDIMGRNQKESAFKKTKASGYHSKDKYEGFNSKREYLQEVRETTTLVNSELILMDHGLYSGNDKVDHFHAQVIRLMIDTEKFYNPKQRKETLDEALVERRWLSVHIKNDLKTYAKIANARLLAYAHIASENAVKEYGPR
jgi:hemerythrin